MTIYLSDEDITRVEDTLASMTLDEKVGQLFCVTDMITDTKELQDFVKKYHPGVFMYRCGDALEIQTAQRAMQEASRIPLLLACNLESGGNGVATTGTFFGRELEVAATGETEQARRLGMVCAKEGAAAGCNWAFSPIVDTDYNWRNPITNVRTFGSDPDVVIKMSKAFMDGVAETGADLAVTIKHFPGDGVDERDQHLLSTVNSLSAEEWEATYGRVYRELIHKGAQAVMVGHILQPAMTRKMCPGIRDEDILPGSTNKYLMTDLLRGEMGFNGLITTDATPMVGFTGTLTRWQAIAPAIMAGADVIVFCKNTEEDMGGVREDIENGVITLERVDNAIRRQLALKASLHLHTKHKNGTIVPGPEALSVIGCEDHARWAAECADKAITLVKDNQSLLSLSPEKTRRVDWITLMAANEPWYMKEIPTMFISFCNPYHMFDVPFIRTGASGSRSPRSGSAGHPLLQAPPHLSRLRHSLLRR